MKQVSQTAFELKSYEELTSGQTEQMTAGCGIPVDQDQWFNRRVVVGMVSPLGVHEDGTSEHDGPTRSTRSFDGRRMSEISRVVGPSVSSSSPEIAATPEPTTGTLIINIIQQNGNQTAAQQEGSRRSSTSSGNIKTNNSALFSDMKTKTQSGQYLRYIKRAALYVRAKLVGTLFFVIAVLD